MRPTSLLLSSFLLSSVYAFRDTYPAVIWSSHSSSEASFLPRLKHTVQKGLKKGVQDASEFWERLMSSEGICGHEDVVIVTQSDLHVNDLRVLSPRSYISTFLSSAPSSIQLPYISYHPHTNISDLQSESLAEQVSRRCGHVIQKPGVVETALMKVGLGSWWGKPKKMHGAGKAKGRVHCVHVNHGTNATEMLDHTFNNRFWHILADSRSHLVVILGTPSETSQIQHRRRALSPLTSSEGSTTKERTKGGIFARYSFLTPGMVTTLLIVFLIWIPLLGFSIYALASIESPKTSSIGRYSGRGEKKHQ